MKQRVKTTWILILFLGFSNILIASDNSTADSIKVAQIVKGFYDWYLTSIREKIDSDFKPKFIESKNGMTTLDYSKYLDNLKAHGFSDSLLMKEKQSYSECIENLEKVKFFDFEKTTFIDLDEYEQANCDFGNFYRWTGGQEPVDGIRIIDIKFISTNRAYVTIDYFEFNSEKNKKYYWGKNGLTLIKIDSDWFIDKIDSWINN
ncbi:hypothetical protein ACE01N_20430 [Saccharicrinis sp. FJH2]|uniref:hypothetical protein n=1 Tax=Saccharicrinis sp. FJH65 TaxID=3344659 RepID=UPI0035F410EE